MFSYSRYYRAFVVLFFSTILFSTHQCTFAQNLSSITIPYSLHHTAEYSNYYFEEALKLALAKTESTSEKVEIKFYAFSTTPERQRAILTTNGGLDLIWDSSSPLREEKMLAIKFNLLRELSDYRLLLIRKEDKAKFAAVKSLADLKQFKAGIASDAAEKKFFQLNNIPFVTSTTYDALFKMLADKRFDYLLRSPQEIWPELEEHKDLPITAEEKLLVAYQSPVYFFVHPTNKKLATRIKKGLEIAEKDGSLKALIMSLPAFTKGYQEIKNKHRTIINMNDDDDFLQ